MFGIKLDFRNSFILMLGLIPVFSWSYHTFFFNEYMSKLLAGTSVIIDNIALPYHIAKISSLSPDKVLLMPVDGVIKYHVNNSFGDSRDGGVRSHQGLDIFAKRGTPVYAAAKGYVMRMGRTGRGGNHIYVLSAGGRRYYYAHLDKFASGIEVGDLVNASTIIGYVGNTGNAINTPSHLHFGMYVPAKGAMNPYNLLADRDQKLAQSE